MNSSSLAAAVMGIGPNSWLMRFGSGFSVYGMTRVGSVLSVLYEFSF